MKSTNWKDIAELVGITAIVASLIFVGLQMMQAQKIAVAAQYHERTSLAVEWLHAQFESDNPAFYAAQCSPDLPAELTLEQAARGCLSLHSFMTISDNHLYQYQAGFLDEESWLARRETIKRTFKVPQAQYLVLEGGSSFRESFVELGRTLVYENERERAE